MIKIDAAAVRSIREAAKLDQSAFGRAMGVSEKTVRNWERGAVIPDAMQLLLGAVQAAQTGSLGGWGGAMLLRIKEAREPAGVD